MKFSSTLTLLITSSLLTACVNQNNIVNQNLQPVSNPCQKITLLTKAYKNDFAQLKQSPIKSRLSNIWQAKYHLFGENCRIWSWGNKETTYACNIQALDQKTAQNYYHKMKETTQQCLNNTWHEQELPKKHNKGMKTVFTDKDTNLSISAHIIPSEGLLKDKWAVYYYIGKPNL